MRLHEKIRAFLDASIQHGGLPVTSIKLSMNEFRSILNDPDARDRYSDGAIYGVPITFTDRDVWTS